MKLLLIVNPRASSTTARKRIVIRKALAADHEVTLAETEHRNHARHLAAQAAADGYDVVAVLAGDGTLNEAANGVVGTHTALAPLPGGSTNVYARTLGLPDDALEATAELLASLEHGEIRSIGVGRANGRVFLFHCGIGFDAAVIRRVERRHSWKRFAGHPLFVASTFDTWARHRASWASPVRIEYRHVQVPGTEPEPTAALEGVQFAIVSKTSPYTYLGHRPIVVAPDASLDSPLALTAFRSLNASTLTRGVASALATGRTLRRSRAYAHAAQLAHLHVSAALPFAWQLDGDDLGDTRELTIDYLPDALRLVGPT